MKEYSVKGWATAATILVPVLVVLGFVLKNQGDFSDNYVHDQLSAQRINFVPIEGLTAPQKAVHCLVANANKALISGEQAECYARYQIGMDLKALYGGKTYAELAYPAKLARDAANTALVADPTASQPATQKLLGDAAQAEIPANVLFKGETLKGLLLTSYGFNVLGERAGQAALTCFIAAIVMAIIAAGLFVTSRRRRHPEVGNSVSSTPATI